MGYDSEDSNIGSEDLRNKYPGGILEKKARSFKALSVEDQRSLLHNSVTGETTEKVKRIKDSAEETAVARVHFVRAKVHVPDTVDKDRADKKGSHRQTKGQVAFYVRCPEIFECFV